MSFKEESNKLYENWKSPYTKDNYSAEDMQRAFEMGGKFIIEKTIKWLNNWAYNYQKAGLSKKEFIEDFKNFIEK